MTRTLGRWFDAYLLGWILGCAGAAVSHVLLSSDESSASHWTYSPGWQREIGFFNIAIASVLLQVLLRRDDDSRRMMARTALVLGPLLGTNHVVALLQGGPGGDRIHWTAIGLNVLSVTVSGILLASDRRERRRAGPSALQAAA